MKKFKILLLILFFSFCSQSSEMTMGVPEPYFGVSEDMATSDVAFSRESSFSQGDYIICLLYTSPSPRDVEESRMPSSA